MTNSRNVELTFKANKGVGRHGWLRLTPAYGVKLVRDRVAHLSPGSIVTDPFSGTGTTPLAAAEHGHLGQSLDVNPFLIWLGKVKTAHYSWEILDEAEQKLAALLAMARDVSDSDQLWQPALFKIERWWSPGALQGLRVLRHVIDATKASDAVIALFEIALCRTLIGTSNAAFNHQSMSFKAPASEHVLFDISETDSTLAVFAKEAQLLIASARTDLPGSATIVQADSRRMSSELEPCTLLLTSPPYVNRMSYIRELRPYMYWLRFLEQSSDAGELDWLAIGGTWGTATSRVSSWSTSQVIPIDDEMGEVTQRIATDGGANGPLLSNYVAKYFHDMWSHFQAMGDYIKPGGAVSYIVGNSTFYGVLVPAEQWYGKLLSAAGYVDVRITTIRKRNSNKALYEYDVTATRP